MASGGVTEVDYLNHGVATINGVEDTSIEAQLYKYTSLIAWVPIPLLRSLSELSEVKGIDHHPQGESWTLGCHGDDPFGTSPDGSEFPASVRVAKAIQGIKIGIIEKSFYKINEMSNANEVPSLSSISARCYTGPKMDISITATSDLTRSGACQTGRTTHTAQP